MTASTGVMLEIGDMLRLRDHKKRIQLDVALLLHSARK